MGIDIPPPRIALKVHADDRFVEAFDGPIKRTWASPAYLVGLSVVAIVMLLLPLVYLGLIVLAAYGVYYHTVENTEILGYGHGYARIAAGIAYLAPIIIGAVLCLFMIKPLFARPARRERRMSLVRQNEPTLFAFVDKLCEIVGSPKPKRIDVDCRVNASASFRRGLLSLFVPGDLVLTIGVPLAAGSTLCELTGVLAHELGHFSQGIGMRLCYIIDFVNSWFYRVVHERDQWDENLIDYCENESFYVVAIAYLARVFVWLGRLILRLLMQVANIVSCAMSRQMEYDADLTEIRVAGSTVFEQSMRKGVFLNAAANAVMEDLRDSWRDGKLGDDLPSLIVAKMNQMPEPLIRTLGERIDSRAEGLFSTHPSMAKRIERARRHDYSGVFALDCPASELFADFGVLAKAITLHFYQDVIGPRFRATNLVSTEVLTKQQKQASRGRKVSWRYFQGCLSTIRLLRTDRYSEVSKLPVSQLVERLKRIRQEIVNSSGAGVKIIAEYTEADRVCSLADIVCTVQPYSVRLDYREFGLRGGSIEEVRAQREEAMLAKGRLEPQLRKLEATLQLRVECAIALMGKEVVHSRVRNGKQLHRRLNTLADALVDISSIADVLQRIRGEQPSLRALLYIWCRRGDVFEGLAGNVERLATAQFDRLVQCRERLRSRRYPFEHTDRGTTLADYAIGSVPSRADLGAISDACDSATEAVAALYMRVIGEVAMICEAAEKAVGLQKLPEPSPSSTFPEENDE